MEFIVNHVIYLQITKNVPDVEIDRLIASFETAPKGTCSVPDCGKLYIMHYD